MLVKQHVKDTHPITVKAANTNHVFSKNGCATIRDRTDRRRPVCRSGKCQITTDLSATIRQHFQCPTISMSSQEDGGTEGRTQRYREAPDKLRAALQDLRSRSRKPVLIVHLGDIIDGAATQDESKKDLDLIASIFEDELVRILRRCLCDRLFNVRKGQPLKIKIKTHFTLPGVLRDSSCPRGWKPLS